MEKIIILVDDDPTFNWVSSKLIEKAAPDLKVNTYANGKTALDFFLKGNAEEKIHYIIFLDINMPIMNGWEFMDALEENDLARSYSIEVYIVTSSTDPSDKETAKSHRLIKDYLEKPLNYDLMVQILS
ncbi:MAG: response regulator [Muricauda sp.]|nr:response regulator [Allomuricauda sp.]MBA4746879.1 response regulator [Allomuricauda sp.]